MAPYRKFLSESLKEISVPPNLECQDQGEEEANTAQEKVSGRTFELKLDKKISRKRLELLLRLFLEAKWFTYYLIANGIANLSHRDYNVDSVQLRLLTLSRSGRSARYHHR